MIKRKMILAHLRAAAAYAETSYAKRLQVGAVIVNQLTDQPVSAGWNGMRPGVPNICEDEVEGQLVSKSDVVHAEINALSKIPSKIPRGFLTLFCTDSPCPDCAHAIVASGVRQVIFSRRYRLDEGIMILLEGGVEVFERDEIELKLSPIGGRVDAVPALYCDKNILLDNNYRAGQEAEPHGLGTLHKLWSTEDDETVLNMFNEGASINEIAAKLDRSFSSICSRLTKNGHLSWAANVGYMESIGGERKLWCSAYAISQNKRAIDKAVSEVEPLVKRAWENKPNIGTIMRLFPNVSPLFLKRICKVNNQ